MYTSFKFLVLTLFLGFPLCAQTVVMQRESRTKSGKRYCGRRHKSTGTKSAVLFFEFSDSALKIREVSFSFVTRILSCYAVTVSTSFFALFRGGS
jgi:hypothetical protein